MEVDLKTPAAEEDNGVGNEEHVSSAIPSDRSPMAASSRSPSSDPGDFVINNKGQLKSTKAEIGKVREENARLKMTLAQTIKDYQSLQMHFFNVVQQDEANWPVGSAPAPNEVEESELVSLTLGTSSSAHKMEDKNNSTSKGKDDKNSSEGPKEEEPGEPWPPSKIPKDLSNGDDEVLQQPQVKKARVCVRTRCDSPTMNDGCQWRKYGQKIAKGNPCPRAYYRCNVAPGCPVRKQVQRCAKDRSMLMTTYEGTHNHPLPVSATAMASTTSAAASMLLSGSSTSQLPTASLASAATANLATASANLNDLSFGLLSDMSRPRQLHLPYPSVSSTTSHPTVTLDLTAPQSSSTSQANQFNWFSSSFTTPTTFNFSNWESHSMPTAWSSGCLSYGSHQPNKSSTLSLSLGRQSQEDFYQTHLKKATNLNAPTANQHPLTDTIAKAITMDPSFQSALAAAVTSHIGALGTEEHFNSGNGCASSYLNRSTSTSSNMQERNCLFLQPSLAFPSTNSASASPVDHNTENIK